LALPSLRLVEPDLPVLAAVLAGAAAYLGGDTGVSHLAAAVGSPAVLVVPSVTRERWAPWSPTVTVFSMSGSDADETDRVTAGVRSMLQP
jgi:ADP-heptose:LPS heptosyltransferase